MDWLGGGAAHDRGFGVVELDASVVSDTAAEGVGLARTGPWAIFCPAIMMTSVVLAQRCTGSALTAVRAWRLGRTGAEQPGHLG